MLLHKSRRFTYYQPWVSRAKSGILSAMGYTHSEQLPFSISPRVSCSWHEQTFHVHEQVHSISKYSDKTVIVDITRWQGCVGLPSSLHHPPWSGQWTTSSVPFEKVGWEEFGPSQRSHRDTKLGALSSSVKPTRQTAVTGQTGGGIEDMGSRELEDDIAQTNGPSLHARFSSSISDVTFAFSVSISWILSLRLAVAEWKSDSCLPNTACSRSWYRRLFKSTSSILVFMVSRSKCTLSFSWKIKHGSR